MAADVTTPSVTVLVTIRPAESRVTQSAVDSLTTTSSNCCANTDSGERATLVRPNSISWVYVS